jgi:hypothetical protein
MPLYSCWILEQFELLPPSEIFTQNRVNRQILCLCCSKVSTFFIRYSAIVSTDLTVYRPSGSLSIALFGPKMRLHLSPLSNRPNGVVDGLIVRGRLHSRSLRPFLRPWWRRCQTGSFAFLARSRTWKAKEAVGRRRHHGRGNVRKKRECRRPLRCQIRAGRSIKL